MNMTIEYPYGPVSLDSSFYIRRPPIEEQACQEITQPGAVIRIRAPKEMGKSSLMFRIADYAGNLGYHIVTINFQQFDADCLNNLDRFLRSFCLYVTRQLGLEPDLDEYWDEDIGSKVSCSLYFHWHLLEQLETPLVLVLNEVNELFEYSELTQDFLPLLRSWYEEAKQVSNWQKLRLLVVYTTEVYVPLKITQSPFNIGLPLTLPEFTPEQVEQLAQLHQLDWNRTKTEQLMAMVGGHPLLIRLTFYHLSQSPDQPLENFLKSAASDRGIYQEHLQRIFQTLEKDPELKATFKDYILAQKPLGLQSILSYKLESLGLVKLKGKQVQVRSELYRQYFGKLFALEADVERTVVSSVNDPRDKILQLAQENHKLKSLFFIDEVTQIGNRQYFEYQLNQQWHLLSNSASSLSLIMIEIDFFQLYQDYYGLKLGENCLREIGRAFQAIAQREKMLVFRYEGSKFIAILPDLNEQSAMDMAKKMRIKVRDLGIEMTIPSYSGFPDSVVTVSLGVVTAIPGVNNDPQMLIGAAAQALSKAKRSGGNSVGYCSSINS